MVYETRLDAHNAQGVYEDGLMVVSSELFAASAIWLTKPLSGLNGNCTHYVWFQLNLFFMVFEQTLYSFKYDYFIRESEERHRLRISNLMSRRSLD